VTAFILQQTVQPVEWLDSLSKYLPEDTYREDNSSALVETFCIKSVSLANGNMQEKGCKFRHSYFIFPHLSY